MKVWIDTGKQEPQREAFRSLLELHDLLSRRIDRLQGIVKWMLAVILVIVIHLLYRTIAGYLS